MVKLFVGGYPPEFTELEIVQLVGPHTTVETIKVVRDKISKKPKGYAFLEVADNAGAERAIDALDGLAMGDRILKINKVAEETGKTSDKQAVVIKDRPKRPRRTIQ